MPVRPFDVSASTPQASDALLEQYVASHESSKAYAARARQSLADNRNIANFSLAYKETIHPIVAASASGAGSSHVLDADGNELIDLGGGFGAVLFGHNPPFVRAAVTEMMRRGSGGMGHAHSVTSRNAAKVCELTGFDACAFVTTGSEATTLACRLCRHHTGRTKVVTFDGSYHGHFDGFLGYAVDVNRPDSCSPISPGIPPSFTRDLIVLKYDDPVRRAAFHGTANLSR